MPEMISSDKDKYYAAKFVYNLNLNNKKNMHCILKFINNHA